MEILSPYFSLPDPTSEPTYKRAGRRCFSGAFVGTGRYRAKSKSDTRAFKKRVAKRRKKKGYK